MNISCFLHLWQLNALCTGRGEGDRSWNGSACWRRMRVYWWYSWHWRLPRPRGAIWRQLWLPCGHFCLGNYILCYGRENLICIQDILLFFLWSDLISVYWFCFNGAYFKLNVFLITFQFAVEATSSFVIEEVDFVADTEKNSRCKA